MANLASAKGLVKAFAAKLRAELREAAAAKEAARREAALLKWRAVDQQKRGQKEKTKEKEPVVDAARGEPAEPTAAPAAAPGVSWRPNFMAGPVDLSADGDMDVAATEEQEQGGVAAGKPKAAAKRKAVADTGGTASKKQAPARTDSEECAPTQRGATAAAAPTPGPAVPTAPVSEESSPAPVSILSVQEMPHQEPRKGRSTSPAIPGVGLYSKL